MVRKYDIAKMLADSLEYCECDHASAATRGQPLNSDVYALLRDIEYVTMNSDESSRPINLHQISSIGQLADQLDFSLRDERLRGS